jgi:transaldolase/glucose-6-phosphate isomerase
VASPFLEIQALGQSIWFDNIRRGLITSGELEGMVEDDGLAGVTSNPAIFEKAIAGSNDYDEATLELVQEGTTAKQLYEALAIADIQMAADVLRPVYDTSEGQDGFVSMEVSPYLAHDTSGTLAEARRLHATIARDNVMIKVPATNAGIAAIRELVRDGIHVNATLLFDVGVYEKVARATMQGLRERVERGDEISGIASVASFFVSRIDSLVDQRVCAALDATRDPGVRAKLKSLLGKVAIANATLAYAAWRDLRESDEWRELAARGARAQRVLWASTSTKNPKYPKTLYVESLIAPETVNTMPAETYNAVRELDAPRALLSEEWERNDAAAQEVMRTLEQVGISMQDVTSQLLEEGVQKFSDAFDKLLAAVENKRQALLQGELTRQTWSLGAAADALQANLENWRAAGKVRRLWHGDSNLWSGSDESRWLGWLHVVEGQRDHDEALRHLVRDVQDAGFETIVLLGMGGSSLCPEVMSRTFGPIAGFPELQVLDSTVPAQVRSLDKRVDPARTLFIVSSKSGTTTEPNAFKSYFFARVQDAVGTEAAGAHFIAITDHGTKLHELAKRDRFRHILHGVPEIGGRYSALSNFGMAPAALMGVDVAAFLDSTEIMVQACGSCVPPGVNPGVSLGAILGTLARQGRDKVTIITSPGIQHLGAWLEQLLAESTGKRGLGLVPVECESLGPPDVYGDDRLFIHMRLRDAGSEEQERAIAALEAAGHPIVRIEMQSTLDLGQEFFRWEIATAVAGSILGINAFDQPDVEASKVATRKLTTAYEASGELAEEKPLLREGEMSLFADPRNAAALQEAATGTTLEALLAAHLDSLRPRDYFAMNAYVEMSEANQRELQAIRHRVRDAKHVATTLGFGPRFLHSTGQLHKGGPNRGVFLQVTSDDVEDVEIPGSASTFGILKRFQAQGDLDVLVQRERRVLRLHLGRDVELGLKRLRQVFESITA